MRASIGTSEVGERMELFLVSAMRSMAQEQLSAHMRAIRSIDTRPELILRGFVHGMGYRYRLHRRNLPGAPDLVFASRHKVIFMHGFFWHQHDCVLGRKQPSSNQY